VWLGDAWAARGELRKAEKSYEAALVLHPEMIRAHIGLAWLDVRAGRVDEAEERLREGFRRTDHPSYLLALSDVLAAAGRPDSGLLRDLPDVLEVAHPTSSVLPRVELPSGRAPLGPPPVRLQPVPPRQPRWLKRMGVGL
jgi:tetratricopeptide (TPR) repeat protein